MLFPINPKIFVHADTHAYVEGFLCEEDINKILAMPQWLTTTDGAVGNGPEGEVKATTRRTKVSWIEPNDDTRWLWEKVSNAAAEINNRFFQFDLAGCYEPIQLGIYSANDEGHYDWHTDSGTPTSGAQRKLSLALLLSDPSEFEGGRLELKTTSDVPITVEQKKGRAWVFPSYTLHRVTPVTKGIRRSLVLWVGGPTLR